MKRLVKLLVVGGVVAAVLALLSRRPAPPSASPTAPPTPPPPKPKESWVEPAAGGGCPDGYPVKAKLSSKIFHVPEGALYERTVPDRCYATADAAEADGLRASKR